MAQKPSSNMGTNTNQIGGTAATKGTKVDNFDINFIAREYAIHEKWGKTPKKGRNQVTHDVKLDESNQNAATIPLQKRKELINQA